MIFIVGSTFGPVRFLLSVCWLKHVVGFYAHWTYMRGYHKWALAHSSSCLPIYTDLGIILWEKNHIKIFCSEEIWFEITFVGTLSKLCAPPPQFFGGCGGHDHMVVGFKTPDLTWSQEKISKFYVHTCWDEVHFVCTP